MKATNQAEVEAMAVEIHELTELVNAHKAYVAGVVAAVQAKYQAAGDEVERLGQRLKGLDS